MGAALLVKSLAKPLIKYGLPLGVAKTGPVMSGYIRFVLLV